MQAIPIGLLRGQVIYAGGAGQTIRHHYFAGLRGAKATLCVSGHQNHASRRTLKGCAVGLAGAFREIPTKRRYAPIPDTKPTSCSTRRRSGARSRLGPASRSRPGNLRGRTAIVPSPSPRATKRKTCRAVCERSPDRARCPSSRRADDQQTARWLNPSPPFDLTLVEQCYSPARVSAPMRRQFAVQQTDKAINAAKRHGGPTPTRPSQTGRRRSVSVRTAVTPAICLPFGRFARNVDSPAGTAIDGAGSST